MLLKNNKVYCRPDSERLHQGDILSDISIIRNVNATGSELIVEDQELPYAVLMTQDCDLEQDFNSRRNSNAHQDKWLPSVLICPAYPAEQFKQGTHLESYEQKMEKIPSDRMKQIKQNAVYRYHYLQSDIDLNVPELVVDFKHYYTISREVAYSEIFKKKYIATISHLFRENLSARFCHYLSRIGLPENEPLALKSS